MKLGRAIGFAAAALLAGCTCGERPLEAVVTMLPGVSATCLRVAVTDPASTPPGTLLGERRMPIQPGRLEYRVAVFQGGMPAVVDLFAQALSGTNGCTDPMTMAGTSPVVQAAFTTTGNREVPLEVGPVSMQTSITIANLPAAAVRNACVPFELQLTNASGAPEVATTPTTVSLVDSLGAVAFFTDATCSTPNSSAVIPASSSQVTASLRPNSPGITTIGASALGYAGDSEAIALYPTVRTGSCRMDVGATNISCPIAQPVLSMSHAFAMVQAITAVNFPASGSARCGLTSTAINCTRDGGDGAVDIGWQVAELPTGANVQRMTANCSSGTLFTLPQATNPSESFVLLTAQHLGDRWDEDDHKTIRLVDAGAQVELLGDGVCGLAGVNDVQVVQLAGAVVDRGQTGPFATAGVPVLGLPIADLGRTFALSSARFDLDPDAGALAGLHVRSELTSSISIAFTRGDGNSSPLALEPPVVDVSWERVQLPATYSVQQIVLAITDGGSYASAAINPVDPQRSLVFASGQFLGGQAFGETSFLGDDVPGTAAARLFLGAPNRVDLVRAVDGGTARWTGYVVQLP